MTETIMYKTYENLITIVRTFDIAAANYLDNEARQLPDFNARYSLGGCFLWASTPQGGLYWSKISSKVDEYKRNGKKVNILPDELFEM